MSAEQGDPHRLGALAALASAAVLAILSIDIVASQFPRGLIVLACLAIAVASAWYGLTRTGGARLLGSAIAILAVAAIVGNEDGAHAVTAGLFQGLNDEGWTIPAAAACYWVGEAMGRKDLKDLDKVPDKVTQTAAMVAANAAHLARLLKAQPYAGIEGGG